MSFLSFDEKAWDKLRPFTIKKTGVSEAIRAFEKAVPSKIDDLQNEAAATAAADLLDTLADKLSGAKGRMDARKHADVIKSLTAWGSEVSVRRKAILNHGAKLSQQFEAAIADANKAIDPLFEQSEDLTSACQDLLSHLQDKAKKAMIAGAKGLTDEVLECQNDADKAQKSLQKILTEARQIPEKAKKAAEARLPPYKLLNQGQAKKHELTVNRYTAIKYKVENLGDLLKPFNEAVEAITFAGNKGEALQEKFAKLIEADVAACRKLASEIGGNETSIAMDLQACGECLDEAQKGGIEPQAKSRLIGEATLRLKGGAERLKRFNQQIKVLDKMLQTRIDGYPDFVSRDNGLFKGLLDDLAKVRTFADDMASKSAPAFMKKAKTCGETIVRLQNG